MRSLLRRAHGGNLDCHGTRLKDFGAQSGKDRAVQGRSGTDVSGDSYKVDVAARSRPTLDLVKVDQSPYTAPPPARSHRKAYPTQPPP